MKKFLFKTTALVSALTVVAGSAVAGGHGSYGGDSKGKSNLDITIGGYADFQVGFVSEDIDFEDANNNAEEDSGEKEKTNYKFRTDAELHFNIDGVADNGLKYGAEIELEAGLDDDDDVKAGKNADIAYLYVDSVAGKFEMGDVDGASTRLKVDAGTIARATGGIDGKFYQYITQDVGGITFLDAPDIGITSIDGGETAGKISYYSPVFFSGFQFGASFIPDSGDWGNGKSFSTDEDSTLDKLQYEDVFEFGLNYEGNIDSVGIVASLTGQFGDVQEEDGADTMEDLEAFAFGLGLNYEGFSFVASYGHTDDIEEDKDSDREYYTAGISYETGPFGASITYLHSTVEDGDDIDNDFHNVSIGADYKLAPGFLPYIEASFFDYDKDENDDIENDGTVVLVGSKLKF